MSRVKELRGEVAVARRMYRISQLAFGADRVLPSFERIKTMTEDEVDCLCEGLQPMKLKNAALQAQLSESKTSLLHMHRRMRELEREIARLNVSVLDMGGPQMPSDSEWCVVSSAEAGKRGE